MSHTLEEAKDLMLARFKEQWDADTTAAVGEVPPVEWPNVRSGSFPPKDGYWARITIAHNGGGQSTLGGIGYRKFERTGLVLVQVFAPAGAQGVTPVDQLGKIARDAFEGKKAGEVWFRNVRLSEVPPDGGPWVQNNVVAEFSYFETK
jgi:hypothetical protein